jgi:hypothetical protein
LSNTRIAFFADGAGRPQVVVCRIQIRATSHPDRANRLERD